MIEAKLNVPAPSFPLLASLLLLLAAPAAARPGAAVALTNGSQPIVQLLIGDDLYATISEAPPEAAVELRLFTPDRVQLAAEMVLTDAAGNTPAVLLWVRTGVVGCDPCFPADPAIWSFQTFAQAEAALDRQELTLEVTDPFSQQLLATVTLPIAAPKREIAYFSRADGCPRSAFDYGKPIHLSLWRPNLSLPQRRLFLPFAAAAGWPVGQPIADARGGLQLISVPPTLPGGAVHQATFLVTGTAMLAPGSYDGIFRLELTDAPLVLPGDAQVASRYDCGDGRIRGGLQITLDDCTNCPPPGDG